MKTNIFTLSFSNDSDSFCVDLRDELGPDSSADGSSFIHIHINIILLSFPLISSSVAHFQAITVQKL